MLFAPDYGTQNPDHRTVETLAPLAQLLGLPIATPCAHDGGHDLVHHHILPSDPDTAGGSVVLVCWDHQNIPDILDALARAVTIVPRPALSPTGWPDDRYDVILRLIRTQDPAVYRCEELPQLLLHRDSSAPLVP